MENSPEQKNTPPAGVEARLSDDGSFELVVSDTGRMAALNPGEHAPGEDISSSEALHAPAEHTSAAQYLRRYRRPLLVALVCAVLLALGIWALSGDDDAREGRERVTSRSGGFKPYRDGAAGRAGAGAASGRAGSRSASERAGTAAGAGRVRGSEAPQNSEVARDLQEDLEQIRQQQGWELDEGDDLESAPAQPALSDRPSDEARPDPSDPALNDNQTANDDPAVNDNEADERDEALQDDEARKEEEARNQEQYGEGYDEEEPVEDDEYLDEQDEYDQGEIDQDEIDQDESDDQEHLDDSEQYDEESGFIGEDNRARRRVDSPQLQRLPMRGLEQNETRGLGNIRPRNEWTVEGLQGRGNNEPGPEADEGEDYEYEDEHEAY